MSAKSDIFRRAVLGIICIEIVGSSIFFGAVHTWAWSSLVALSCLAFVLFLCDKTFLQNETTRSFPKPLLASLALFILSLSLQLVIPIEIDTPASPRLTKALDYFNVSHTIPSLFSFYYAKLALYRWIAPLVTFVLIPYALHSKRDLMVVLTTIVATGSLQGIYGIAQYLGKDPLPFFARYDKQYPVGGSYICRNTYACFMAMGTTVAMGMILQLQRHRRKIRIQGMWQIRSLVENPHLPWIALITLGALAMALGTFFSLSRAGVILLISGSSLFAVLYFLHRPRRKYALSALVLSALLLIGPLTAYLYITGIEPLLTRFGDVSQGEESRWELSMTAAKIFKRHWLLGCGGGCYGFALEIYKPPKFRPYLYAHNDYLQFLAEYGIIAFMCSLLVFGTWVRTILRKDRENPLFSLPLWCCCASALCVLLGHAVVDFSLHIPGHRLVGAVLMGCMLAMSNSRCGRSGHSKLCEL